MLRYPNCARWHDTSNSSWINDTSYGFRRGDDGVFSFRGSGATWDSGKSCGRGVAVVK